MPGATRAETQEVTKSLMDAHKNEKRLMEAKVSQVREVVSHAPKEHVVMVLQHFELDVEKTIQAFCEDGAKDALDTWSGGKTQSANARKNQRKKANKKAAAATAPTNGHHDPLHTNGGSAPISNGPPAPLPVSSVLSAPPPRAESAAMAPKPQRVQAKAQAPLPSSPQVPASIPPATVPVPMATGPLYQPPERTRTVSSSSVADAAGKKKALEKELKQLSRHDSNMERVKERFYAEVEKASERKRRAFAEMRDKLTAREAYLVAQLAGVKVDGTRLINEKEAYGRALHARAERAAQLSEKELDELRHDVKAFTADRRLEEDFASTLRFSYEPDALSALIASFGSVAGVKSMEKATSAAHSGPNGGHLSSHSSLAGSLDTDSGFGHSLSPMSPEKKSTTVQSNGITMRSESLTEEQLEQINRKLQESLLSQGISTNVMGLVSGNSGPMPVVRRGPPRGGRGGRGGGEGGGRGGRGAPRGRGKPGPQISIME